MKKWFVEVTKLILRSWKVLVLVVFLVFALGAIALMGNCVPKSIEIHNELSSFLDARGLAWNGSQLLRVNYTIGMYGNNSRIIYEEPVAFAFILLPSRILDANPEYFLMRFILEGEGTFSYGMRVYKMLVVGPPSSAKASPTVFFSYAGRKDRPDFLRLDTYPLEDYQREAQALGPFTDEIQFFTSNATFQHAYTNLIKGIQIVEFNVVHASEGLVGSGFVDHQSLMLSVGFYLGLMVVLPVMFLLLGGLRFRRLLNVKWIILFGLALRVILSVFTAHNYDMEISKFAVRTFYEHGEIALFSNWTSPPIFYFSLILFYFPYAVLHYYVGFSDWRVFFIPVRAVESLFIKMPMILADVLIFVLLIRILHHLKPDLKKERAVLLGSLFFLNPYVIMISSVWGMFDALAIVFIVAGVYMWMNERQMLAGFLFAISVATKWIGIAPLLFGTILLLRSGRFRKALQMLFVGILTSASIFAFPFVMAGRTDFLLEVLSFRVGRGSDVARWYGLSYLDFFRKLNVFSVLPKVLVADYFFIVYGAIGACLCLAAVRTRFTDSRDWAFKLIGLTLLAFLGFYLAYRPINEQFLLWSIALLPLILLENEKIKNSISSWIVVVAAIGLGWAMMEVITGQTFVYMLVGFPDPTMLNLQPPASYQAGFSLVFSFLCTVLVWRLSGLSEKLRFSLLRRDTVVSAKRATQIVVYMILFLSLIALTWAAEQAVITRIAPSLALAIVLCLFFVVAPLTAVALEHVT